MSIALKPTHPFWTPLNSVTIETKVPIDKQWKKPKRKSEAANGSRIDNTIARNRTNNVG